MDKLMRNQPVALFVDRRASCDWAFAGSTMKKTAAIAVKVAISSGFLSRMQ
jgi:hypothetical protein